MSGSSTECGAVSFCADGEYCDRFVDFADSEYFISEYFLSLSSVWWVRKSVYAREKLVSGRWLERDGPQCNGDMVEMKGSC